MPIAARTHGCLVTLYVIGAGLEVADIGLVVAEMRADRRKAAEIATRPSRMVSGGGE